MSTLDVKFRNPTSRSPEGFWPITVPRDFSQSVGDVIEFTSRKGKTLGYKVRDIGSLGALYNVKVGFLPDEEVVGTIAAPSGDVEVPKFDLHKWVSDDLKALLPNVFILISNSNPSHGGLYSIPESSDGSVQYDEVKLIRSTPTTTTWRLRGRPSKIGRDDLLSGFVFHVFATITSGSPVIELRAALIWADPKNPEPDLYVDRIELSCGEFIKFDYDVRNRHDVSQPVFDKAKWWFPIVDSRTDFNKNSPGVIGFVDGCGIPIVGKMLCVPQNNPINNIDQNIVVSEIEYAEAVGVDIKPEDRFVIESSELLYAGAQGRPRGIVINRGWDGKFIGMGHIGRVEHDSNIVHTDILSLILKEPAQHGFWNQRPIGAGIDPGQTGDQEDFGATKGILATVFEESDWIDYAIYSVVIDVARGYMYHEEDGTPIDPDKHPNWTTWSQLTHWHHGQSSDRLGKRDKLSGEGVANNGILGYDDQHRSQNNLAAVYLLSGDDFLEFIIKLTASNDSAHVRIRNNFGYGAPRACGRRSQTWSNFKMLTDPDSKEHAIYQKCLDWNIDVLPNYFEGDKNNGPIDILYQARNSRYGLKFPNTDFDLHLWVVWEHALMCRGLLIAYRATGDLRNFQYAKRISKTIVDYGFFFDQNTKRWLCADLVWYPTPNEDYNPADVIPGWTAADVGKPIPSSLYYDGSFAIYSRPMGGVCTWTLAAGLLTYFATHDKSDSSWQKAILLIESFTSSEEAHDSSTAEWWAVVNSISDIVKTHS